MFFQKKTPPEKKYFGRADFSQRISEAISEGMKSRIHLLDLANELDNASERLRVRHASTAPL